MGRRELREQIFKLLFRIEFNDKEDMPEQEELFFQEEENTATEKEEQYITAKYEEIASKLDIIDDMINKAAKGWDTTRMGKVDLTLIRLAVYEIQYDDEIPTGVAINEAVELAKKFGQENSPAFVNGILAKFA
ncbi:MAG TPA: transcription antitermination factor NusB [Lachnospiraceae bacterium]|nr:transcription antitermination factor NusB [Lachnospiraceae bacterium]